MEKIERRPFTITQLRQDPAGFWRARVTCDGCGVDVDNAAGSWLADVRRAPGHRTFVRRFVLPHVAAALQAKVRPLEKAAMKGNPEQAPEGAER